MKLSSSVDVVIPIFDTGSSFLCLAGEVQAWVDLYADVVVYIVDDASPIPVSKDHPLFKRSGRVFLISHENNLGRAAARNSGLRKGGSSVVAFLDADCIPDVAWIPAFVGAIDEGCVGVFGSIRDLGRTFWSRYRNASYARWEKNYYKNKVVGSTAFCAFKRHDLLKVDGFFEGYNTYGFEDRDLLNTLNSVTDGAYAFLPHLVATHHAADKFQELASKMFEAGKFSSNLYAKRHSEQYQFSEYWWFDYDSHGWAYNIFMLILFIPFKIYKFPSEKFWENTFIPFKVRSILARVYMALYYYRGTRARPD